MRKPLKNFHQLQTDIRTIFFGQKMSEITQC